MNNHFSRRETLRLLGAAGASALIGLPDTARVDYSGVGLAGSQLNKMLYEPIAEWDATQSRYVAVPIDLGAALSATSATIGGVNGEVLYAGSHPTYVGLDQANILIPRSLAGRGNVDVEFTADGVKANTVTINIK